MRSTGETLQWTTNGLAKERFAHDETTKTLLTTRTLQIAGKGTEGWTDAVPLDDGTDFDQCRVFFSISEDEQAQRALALTKGAIVITEQHLAQYFDSVEEIDMLPVKRLAEWTTRKELIQ